MRIGLVGGSYQERSLPFDAQRSVNLFPVLDDKGGKEVGALYGTPGLSLFTTCGIGPARACFYSANGRCFVVSGSGLYELTSLGVATLVGTLLTSSGIVSIDENPFQLGMCDGTSVYIFTYATNVFAQVVDVDLPISGTLTYQDGYFIVTKVGTGSFYISAINDGTSWAALDFATAESSPDELLRCINAVGFLWLFGTKTTEIWGNTGASSFPFSRTSGGKMETGILAPHSAVAIDNSVIWVGRDNIGSGVVYRAQGFTPQRISTNPIELLLQAATSPSTIRAYTYQQDGHTFYVITGGGLATTLVYDLSTQFWHERAFTNTSGAYEAHLGACGMFAFNQQMVGDRRNGSVYLMNMTTYSDAGSAIVRERIYTHISDENKQVRYNSLDIGFETGTGLQTGQGSDPLVSLRVSKDGARTWSSWRNLSIGAVGKYITTVNFMRLGVARQLTLHLRISDPVKVAICGSYLR